MSILGQTTAGDPTADNSSVQPAPISGGIVSAAAPTAPVQTTPTQQQQQPTQPAPAQGGSRLARIIQSVAQVADTALASVPDKGRSSFLTGAGEGARAEQAQIANQQAIKFKTFDDSVRAAQLHNQDLEIQARTQAQADAHQAAQDTQHDWDEAHGLQYQEIPNSGQAATDYLTAQSGNGGASIPPGTHLSADGKTILIPKQSEATQAALLKKYQTFASAYNLPSLPDGAQFVPGKFVDFLQNKLEGKNLDGSVIKHDDLLGAIADLQTTRDSLAKTSGADPNVLSQIDGTLAHLKANQTALDDHQQSVLDAASQRKQDEQTNLTQQKGEQARLTNAAKPQKPQSDAWVQGATSDEKKKAELAENMVYNINNVASILKRRPDIVGVVGGRFTSVQQMAGSNDPDIVALGTDIHNIGMANGGIHGMRSPQQAEDYANQVLNHFKNGPKGVYGGLKSSADSVQTFIDAARPETYKTHSKQGGAIRAMVPQGQQQ